MRLSSGFRIGYDWPAPVPMPLMLSVHASRRRDLETADDLHTEPVLDVRTYEDGLRNICSRLVAPPGPLTHSANFVVRDTGLIDPYVPDAPEHAVQDLPISLEAPPELIPAEQGGQA